ncbi:hypothetical protein [Shewanella sp.]|uniref:hypothetical protein n=1 Tax=Shewanella sp. TaxID=50422 RepID=UPI0040488E70
MNLKANYVFTNYIRNWDTGLRKKVTHELFIKYWLEENERDNFELEVLDITAYTNLPVLSKIKFIERKYERYLKDLEIAINEKNEYKYEEKELNKSIGLDLKRLITLSHDAYTKCKIFYNEKSYACKVLDDKSYYTPNTFQELRDFYQDTAYGQEQLFAIYIKLLTKNYDVADVEKFEWPAIEKQNSIKRRVIKLFTIDGFSRLIEIFCAAIFRLVKPKIIVYESYFSNFNRLKILIKSRGKIQFANQNIYIEKLDSFDWELREEKFKNFEIEDDFDRYFLEILKVSFPKNFVENNCRYEKSIEEFSKRYENCDYIINESWIGSGIASGVVARAEKYGLKHIYNEHNFPCHFYLGNYNKYLIKNVNCFLSLGWSDASQKNHKKGSSLRNWKISRKKSEFEILYISGPPVINTPDYSGSCGGFGLGNARLKIDFVVNFFNKLDRNILKKIHYRGYPNLTFSSTSIEPKFTAHNIEYLIRFNLNHVASIDDFSTSTQALISRSKLVIVDYLSTSYIEALISGVPTIFFMIEDSYLIKEKFRNLFDELIIAQVCHVNYESAINFLFEHQDRIDEWWISPLTKNAVKNFLDATISIDDTSIDYFISLTH